MSDVPVCFAGARPSVCKGGARAELSGKKVRLRLGSLGEQPEPLGRSAAAVLESLVPRRSRQAAVGARIEGCTRGRDGAWRSAGCHQHFESRPAGRDQDDSPERRLQSQPLDAHVVLARRHSVEAGAYPIGGTQIAEERAKNSPVVRAVEGAPPAVPPRARLERHEHALRGREAVGIQQENSELRTLLAGLQWHTHWHGAQHERGDRRLRRPGCGRRHPARSRAQRRGHSQQRRRQTRSNALRRSRAARIPATNTARLPHVTRAESSCGSRLHIGSSAVGP